MLPTFVIGLREGLEASLIVGIVAGFLGRQGRRDALRQVWLGVVAAVLICIVVGVVLEIISADLPQAEQEGLETVIGLFAVAMVTYMVMWMRKHSRDLKGELEGQAGAALARGSATALVVMAFLAVLREGFETAVFLLAAFQASTSPVLAGSGALIGIVLAVVLGYGIYKGGVRLNLSKFFRITGVVLVVVAAGLVMTAFHTAHEAGWVNFGQQRVADLSWLVLPGTPVSSLVTGVLGIQPYPVLIEVVAWFVYLVPLMVYLLWPQGGPARRVPAEEPSPASAG
ncbi:MAG: high-affinity iron transporter [Pseudonocardiales bacterium]|jgi:high-affinity iron transporter|nr:high-affinity iron transporter [Pseudonocardiales bacterium]MDT7587652.1 high-affinity iron transporter [Pseudonocardiales bacterium]MDT7628298.1 high-affinity iron transporter [Pseudonocardiales bacterium]MDT7683791.1 high-affinity iron transporter [Pseudonocardiales bacterium]MDT7752932.1 high-affinity iron transporter [Pseudonocardiales bacterium]